MGPRGVLGLIVVVVLLGARAVTAAPPDDPVLVIHGEPYATGEITLTVGAGEAWEGAPVWLLLGFDPLPLLSPVSTGKGPFWVGSITHVRPFGVMPVGAPLHVTTTMPEILPGAEGFHFAVQMLLPGRLTNAATVPLDAPYFLPAQATTVAPVAPQQNAAFGETHAVGDFNGDGAPDLALGAWFEDGPFEQAGRVYVRWGPDFELSTELASPAPGAWHVFGLGLHVVDLDHDDVDELVIAEASGYPDQPDDPGRLWVFSGAPTVSTELAGPITGTASGFEASTYGRRLASGDYDGDGWTDLAVSVVGAEVAGHETAGRIDVFWGPDFDASTALTSPAPGASEFFGTELLTADVNGDGIDDLVEASSRADAGGAVNIGRIHLFTGPGLAFATSIENPLPEGENSRFGNSLAAVDLDGDGADEILTADQNGRAYVFWSPAFDAFHTLVQPPSATGPDASFGYFMAAGDANGDGHTDICVGAPFAEGTGLVHVYLGPHFGSTLSVREPVPESLALFGWGISLANVDDDPELELVVGTEGGAVQGVPGAGHVSIFDGSLD